MRQSGLTRGFHDRYRIGLKIMARKGKFGALHISIASLFHGQSEVSQMIDYCEEPSFQPHIHAMACEPIS